MTAAQECSEHHCVLWVTCGIQQPFLNSCLHTPLRLVQFSGFLDTLPGGFFVPSQYDLQLVVPQQRAWPPDPRAGITAPVSASIQSSELNLTCVCVKECSLMISLCSLDVWDAPAQQQGLPLSSDFYLVFHFIYVDPISGAFQSISKYSSLMLPRSIVLLVNVFPHKKYLLNVAVCVSTAGTLNTS